MKKLVAIISLVFLTACGTIRSNTNDGLKIDERTMQSCKDLPELQGTLDTEILAHTTKFVLLYAECRKWNEEKKKVLEKVMGRK